MQAGTALSTFLPDHIGNDSFMSNYSQAMIPGLVTGLTGIRYAPCLLRSSAVGAAAGATGVIFNPSLFAARPTGAGPLTSTPPPPDHCIACAARVRDPGHAREHAHIRKWVTS